MIKITCDICGSEHEMRGIVMAEKNFISLSDTKWQKASDHKCHICMECLGKLGYREEKDEAPDASTPEAPNQ